MDQANLLVIAMAEDARGSSKTNRRTFVLGCQSRWTRSSPMDVQTHR